MKTYVIILLAGIGSLFITRSQSITPSIMATTGGFHTTSTVSLSYTLGEVATQTLANESIILTQGFQQPSYGVTILIQHPILEFDIAVYPVPATHYLTIKIEGDATINHQAILFDISGNQVMQQEVNANEVQLDMQWLPPAEYILQINNHNGMFLKSFKIIKQ